MSYVPSRRPYGPMLSHGRLTRGSSWTATIGILRSGRSPIGHLHSAYTLPWFSLIAVALCLYWGRERVALYNEKLAGSLGGAHPLLMGRSAREVFSADWDQLCPIFDQAAVTAQTVDLEDRVLFLERNGYLEETYFIGQFIPLRGDSGEIEGFYNTCFETTDRMLHERRRRVVGAIAAIQAESLDRTLSSIMDALHGNPNDITMAMLYACDDLADRDDTMLRLCGLIGIPDNHQIAPKQACLQNGQSGLVFLFRKAKILSKPLVFTVADASHEGTQGLFEGIQWCGYGEPSQQIIVVPLLSGSYVLGFYVQGINPRRPYDEEYEMSVVDTARQMETKWVASSSFERGVLREQALERRATDSENRLHHMAKSAPLDMCQVTPGNKIQWANDQYYEITGHDPSEPDLSSLFAQMDPDNLSETKEALGQLLAGKPRVVREVRLNRRWMPPVIEGEDAEPSFVWMLTLGFPLIENGKVKLVMAYVTDISHQKWAEDVQVRNVAAAISAKRRQEDFIDTTSHEMRNPLNAMIQLADGISHSLRDADAKTTQDYIALLEDNVDSASTILACAAHQKRVIDDVLILSRLESQMLSITPVAERPDKVVSESIKIFEAEAKANNLTMELLREHSYDTLSVEYALIDTSRLMQIMINLISNSIKFTITQPARKISIAYGAQTRRPPHIQSVFGEVSWTPPVDPDRVNVALSPAEKDAERLYLYFWLSTGIQDSGVGMTPEEKDRLFKRFSQASSKTHITYGGSGLGLHICRQLAEKQGGGVGVASKAGEGSIFAFYIETRFAEQPKTANGKDRVPPARSAKPDSSIDGPKQFPRSKKEDVRVPPAAVEQAFPTSATVSHPSSTDAQKERLYSVVLVEDNLINQKVLSKQLRSAKCDVTVANHGIEALRVLDTANYWQTPNRDAASNTPKRPHEQAILPFDVVLMDWEMPIMDGLECSQRIRELEKENDRSKHLPIIAITANVHQEQKDKALAAGADAVLSKPFTVAELLVSIEETVSSLRTGGRGKST